jgi:hypothetical protein
LLKRLIIKNFRSIYSADLRFGKANLFIGPNGAGKSNVLEAIGVLAGALSRGVDPPYLDLRGVRLSIPTMFKSAFRNRKLPKGFSLEAHFEHGIYKCTLRAGVGKDTLEFHSEELTVNGRKVFGRGPNGLNINVDTEISNRLSVEEIGPTRSVWDVIWPVIEIDPRFLEEIDEFTPYSIFAPQTSIMRGVAVDPRVKEPLGLTGAGLAKAFSQTIFETPRHSEAWQRADRIMRSTLLSGWMDLIRSGRYDSDIVPSFIKTEGELIYLRDRYMNTKRNYLSPYDASEGTLYLIFVCTLLAHAKSPKVFAIDNVDGTLNPALVRSLAQLVVNVVSHQCGFENETIDWQCFLTSHHPSSLDAFDIFDENQAIFVVSRSDSDRESAVPLGATQFDRFLPPENFSKEKWIISHGGKNLSDLLLQDRIKGAL